MTAQTASTLITLIISIGLPILGIFIIVKIVKHIVNYSVKKNTEAKYKYDEYRKAEKEINDIAEELKNHQD